MVLPNTEFGSRQQLSGDTTTSEPFDGRPASPTDDTTGSEAIGYATSSAATDGYQKQLSDSVTVRSETNGCAGTEPNAVTDDS